MKPVSNVIESSVVALSCSGKSIAANSMNSFESIFDKELVPIMEELIGERIDPGLFINLEKLDLDLGQIPQEDFERLITERFRSAFAAALESALATGYAQQALPKDRARAADDISVGAIKHYLLKGYLPYALAQSSTVDYHLSRLLDAGGTVIYRLLISVANIPMALGRFADLLTPQQFLEVLRALGAKEPHSTLASIQDLVKDSPSSGKKGQVRVAYAVDLKYKVLASILRPEEYGQEIQAMVQKLFKKQSATKQLRSRAVVSKDNRAPKTAFKELSFKTWLKQRPRIESKTDKAASSVQLSRILKAANRSETASDRLLSEMTQNGFADALKVLKPKEASSLIDFMRTVARQANLQQKEVLPSKFVARLRTICLLHIARHKTAPVDYHLLLKECCKATGVELIWAEAFKSWIPSATFKQENNRATIKSKEQSGTTAQLAPDAVIPKKAVPNRADLGKTRTNSPAMGIPGEDRFRVISEFLLNGILPETQLLLRRAELTILLEELLINLHPAIKRAIVKQNSPLLFYNRIKKIYRPSQEAIMRNYLESAFPELITKSMALLTDMVDGFTPKAGIHKAEEYFGPNLFMELAITSRASIDGLLPLHLARVLLDRSILSSESKTAKPVVSFNTLDEPSEWTKEHLAALPSKFPEALEKLIQNDMEQLWRKISLIEKQQKNEHLKRQLEARVLFYFKQFDQLTLDVANRMWADEVPWNGSLERIRLAELREHLLALTGSWKKGKDAETERIISKAQADVSLSQTTGREEGGNKENRTARTRLTTASELTRTGAHAIRVYGLHGIWPWWAPGSTPAVALTAILEGQRVHQKEWLRNLQKMELERSFLGTFLERLSETDRQEWAKLISSDTRLSEYLGPKAKKGDAEQSVNETIHHRTIKKEVLAALAPSQFLPVDGEASLDVILYQTSDADWKMAMQNLPDHIGRKIDSYLRIAPYFYAKDVGPAKWRKFVYSFLLTMYPDIFGQHAKHGQQAGKEASYNWKEFDAKFLEYLRAEQPKIKWKLLLHSLGRLLSSKMDLPPLLKERAHAAEIKHNRQPAPPNIQSDQDMSIDQDAKIHIENSGIILLWPFLSRYFEQLDLISGGQFKDKKAQNRAAYLLQYLACEEVEFLEYHLVLNKWLVGCPLEERLQQVGGLTAKEVDLSTSLLEGFKANWEKMKNSSIAGIRETFFLREGYLQLKPEGAYLTIERMGVDVLLESIPWNISIVKLPWMPNPLFVEW